MKTPIFITILVVAASLFFASYVKVDSDSQQISDSLKVFKPENQYATEEQLINTILSRYHYTKYDLNDSMSSVIFDKYIDALDYSKIYFLKSDIKDFDQYRYSLDELLNEGDVDPFYDIFNTFTRRMQERINFIDTLLMNEFDYTKTDSVEVNRENSDWVSSYSELNDLWRKRIKNDALTLSLNGKTWDEIVKNLTKRYESYERVLSQYNSEDIFQLAMNSYATTLDPHTDYLSPITSENFKIDMSLSLEGIGARLTTEEGYTKVAEIIPGGPAFKSKKLNVGDRITAVAQGEDGEFVDVIGWRITDVVQLIRGPKETVVRLQILRADDGQNAIPVEITLVRDKVKLEDQAAKSDILEIQNNGLPYRVGVITIPKFYTDFEGQKNGEEGSKSTVTDVKKLLVDFKKEKVDAVIIDLRNNGGGSLAEAIDVTGLFIKDGPVVQVKNSNGSIEIGKDFDPEVVYGGPLAVLVNRFSASASEIFAGAIQDYRRGLIIGEQTYGKGTVQNLIDLNRFASHNANEYGQVKLTIAKYYRVTGGSTQNLGVIPDIKFPSYIDPGEFGESSDPSALPWDQINATRFEPLKDLTAIIPDLISLSEKRRANDEEFQSLLNDINEYRESAKKKYISLNKDIRLKEKEDKEEREFQKENEIRKKKGLKLLEKGELPEKKNIEEEENDLFLNETAMILTDMIGLSEGLTKAH